MVDIGYAISSEEHEPNAIVRHAQLAENAGFGYAFISDHFHPWLDVQGHSPFVWSVIGGIATATRHLRARVSFLKPSTYRSSKDMPLVAQSIWSLIINSVSQPILMKPALAHTRRILRKRSSLRFST